MTHTQIVNGLIRGTADAGRMAITGMTRFKD